MNYINPFDLLNIQSENLSDIDSSTIRRAKKKLLADIELSDNDTIDHNGIELTKSDCIRAVDDLDHKDKNEFHYFIFKNPDLNSFLSSGDLRFFKTYKSESIYKLSEFLDFISPFFTFQYDKQLSLNYKKRDIDKVKLLLSIKPITNEASKELCFKGTYTTIKEIENEIITINKNITDKKSKFIDDNFNGLADLISKNVDVELLNILPIYFQSLRNSLAQTIRNLARDINNDPYNNYKPAYEIIDIANNVSTDGLVKQTISKGYYTIKKNYDDSLPKSIPLRPQVSTVSEPETEEDEEIEEDKIQEKSTEYKSNNYYKGFLFISCGLLIWAIFNNTTRLVILSFYAFSYLASIYNFIKKPEIFKANTSSDKLFFLISVIICATAYFNNNAAILFLLYHFVGCCFTLYYDLVLNKPYNKNKSIAFLVLAIIGTYYLNTNDNIFNNQKSVSNQEVVQTPSVNESNNPINSEPLESTPPPPPPKPVFNYPYIENGNITGCSNIKSKYNKKINNKLVISCGSNADVAVKMIDYATEKSIRYVYIRKNSTYTIKNIPEGRYYLKIAYGSDWGIKEGESVCEGRFTSNTLYKKGDEILDYNIIYSGDGGYQIPSFSLKLDVVFTDDNMNKFETDNINENEFYNE